MNLKPEVIYLVKCRVLTAGKSLNIERSGVVERKCYYFAGAGGNIKQSLPTDQQEFIEETGGRRRAVYCCVICVSWVPAGTAALSLLLIQSDL